MPLSSSPPTPDRNQAPEVTHAVRLSGASDRRSFLCIKMRSSRCHSDLIMSKSTPSRPNPFVDRAPCCDAPYGLHSLGVEAQRLQTLAPGHIGAGIHQKPSPLLKHVRCQLHVLAFCCATCHMAGLPGICDVNVLVSHTIGDDISPSAWSRGTLIPKNRPKVHLPAHSVPRLQRDPPPAARTVAQHAKRTGSLMTDASHRVSKPTPQSVAQSRPPSAGVP